MEKNETTSQSNLRYWAEKLIIPIVILFVGYMINSTLEKQKEEIDKMKFTEQVIKDVFESKNITKGMALYSILPALLHEEKYTAFVNQTQNSIQAYYTNIAMDSVQKGTDAEAILQASTNMTGETSKMSTQIKTAITKAETAKEYEQRGVDALEKNNLVAAKINFETAAKVYPTYHNVSEISTVLRSKVKQIKTQPKDSIKIQESAKRIILAKYSWKLPVAKNKLLQIKK